MTLRALDSKDARAAYDPIADKRVPCRIACMQTSDPKRLADLFRKRQRAAAAAEKIKEWSIAGFNASALSNERHEELVSKLRRDGSVRQAKSGSLNSALADIGAVSDIVAVVGWNVESDPGILLSGKALCRSEGFLREAYPDGFVVCNQPLSRLLLIDFDQDDFEIEEVCFNRRE